MNQSPPSSKKNQPIAIAPILCDKPTPFGVREICSRFNSVIPEIERLCRHPPQTQKFKLCPSQTISNLRETICFVGEGLAPPSAATPLTPSQRENVATG